MAFVLGSNGFIGSHMLGIKEPGVICMAGISDTTHHGGEGLDEANVEWPLQIAADCAMQGLPFVYASSASVYGNGDGPLNAYARSKKTLDDCMATFPGRWYGLRFFNVWGPHEAHKGKQASMVHQAMEQVDRDGFVTLFNVEASRDFVHVSDCVSVARWLLQTLPPSGIYDVGTGVSRPFEDIAQCLGAGIAYVPMPEHLKGKYQFHTQADLSKLRAAGYTKPFLSLEEGIQSMRFKQAA